MACQELSKIIAAAVGSGTPDAYNAALPEVALLLLSGELCVGHQRIAARLINTTDDLAPLFAKALRELQGMERLRIFRHNIATLSGDMTEIFGLLFPGEPATLASRILAAAKEGNPRAMMMVRMYSKTEEEMEAMMAIRIPVSIVPDRGQ